MKKCISSNPMNDSPITYYFKQVHIHDDNKIFICQKYTNLPPSRRKIFNNQPTDPTPSNTYITLSPSKNLFIASFLRDFEIADWIFRKTQRKNSFGGEKARMDRGTLHPF